MWDFSTDPEFQEQLDWMGVFVREEVEPLDLLFPRAGAPYDTACEPSRDILRPLQDQVRQRGLWACHLGPELGGRGYGQVKLALMNEIPGRSHWALTVFGTAAPDTGNAGILAMFGTAEQKKRYLQPSATWPPWSGWRAVLTMADMAAAPGERAARLPELLDEAEQFPARGAHQ